MKGSAATGYGRARASFPLFVRPEMTFALLRKSYTHLKKTCDPLSSKGDFFFQSWLPYLLLSYYILLLIHKRWLISIDLPRSYLRSSYTIATFFILSDWKKRITLASTRKIFSGRNRPWWLMLERVRRVLIESDIEVSFSRRILQMYTQISMQPPTTCAHGSRAGRPPSHRFKFALLRS